MIDRLLSILHLIEMLGNNETQRKKLLKIIAVFKDKMEGNSA